TAMAVKFDFQALVGLMPVLTFLVVLLYLDSYKLVNLRTVIVVVVCGAVAALASYFANAAILQAVPIELQSYSRYGAPLLEELCKGLIIVVLIRTHRIGFLVDAAIFGFAAGAGFAMVENIYFLGTVPDAGMGTWMVRGFGTAIMHGGATALFAVMAMTILERSGRQTLPALLPGFALAVLLHSAFNHLTGSPRLSMLAIILVLPPLFYLVFERGEKATGDWLGKGFDADAEMLASLNSGNFSESPMGKYLHTLKDKFKGAVLADILCYLRLHTELAMRAKGILMMRENGFNTPVDESTREKFTELRYLEGSIGKTGLLAIHPMLHISHKDLWQLYMLGK
ncbi:MAG: PrsW family glutamic-type intramembrane protease, partial [Casimicrobiaceae bacterium]